MRDDWQIHGDERSLPALLGEVKELAIDELHRRLGDEGYPDIRPGHGCVFRFIEPGGSRLTQIAERAGMTKQAVGEVVADLERLGDIERRWAREVGEERLAALRETVEAVLAGERAPV